MWSSRILISALALALGAGACGPPPPPEPPKPKPAPKTKKPKPPPEPKCQELEEDCRADGDTMAAITISGYGFQPPKGWAYARMKAATITQVDESGPVLVLTSFEPEGGKKGVATQRQALLGALSELAGVELPDKKLEMAEAEQTDEVGGLKMEYWQREKAKRGKGTGSLLVLSTKTDVRALFGFGYVPDDDKTEADRVIFEALESIEKVKKADEGDESDEDEDEKEDSEKDSKKSSRSASPAGVRLAAKEAVP